MSNPLSPIARRVVQDEETGVSWFCSVQHRMPALDALPGEVQWIEYVVCLGGPREVALYLAHGELGQLSDAELVERIRQARLR